MVDIPEKPSKRQPKLIGKFIRERREALNLSQRGLGQLFTPPVTTQFISNVERGVTPLPPAHVPVLAQALQVQVQKLMNLLEAEYVAKLSGKLSSNLNPNGSTELVPIIVSGDDHAFIRSLYEVYRGLGESEKRKFQAQCQEALQLAPKLTVP